MDIKILKYQSKYSNDLVDIFYDSVHSIDPLFYSQEEKSAWARHPKDYSKWGLKFEESQPLIALYEKSPIGFIELLDTGYIDCFYIKPEYQKIGVGNLLYSASLEKAKSLQLTQLKVNASLVAKKFFLKKDFSVIRKNEVLRDNQRLINFSMEKFLD